MAGAVDPSRPGPGRVLPGAQIALILMISINLFNYIDRQVLSAVLPLLEIDTELFSPSDPWLKTKLSSLSMAFMVSYMLIAPVFGWLGDRFSRWWLVGVGVILWSLASGGSGLAVSFTMLLLTRCFVGIGEAAYGPVAPSMLSDLYPVERRGKILAWFYLAIPVGSALGFVIGGQVAEAHGWRMAFLVVMVPGLILGLICFFLKEPPRAVPLGEHISYTDTLKKVLSVPSWLCCTIGMTASTFLLGGIALWTPSFFFERQAEFIISPTAVESLEQLRASDKTTPLIAPEVIAKLRPLIGEEIIRIPELKSKLTSTLTKDESDLYYSRIFDAARAPGSPSLGGITTIFGGIVVVTGLLATLLGGWLGDKLREKYSGAYFLVAGYAALLSYPFFVAMIFLPFPYAWIALTIAVFGLFVNTGPANTILANVVPSRIRATAFALNILLIHALGDAVSPTIIGFIADLTDLSTAFTIVATFILIAGGFWIAGAKHLNRDTEAATRDEGF